MLVLTEKDVYSLLSNLDRPSALRLLSKLHAILRQHTAEQQSSPTQKQNEKLIHQPPRQTITTKNGDTSLFMPSSTTTTTAIKTVTVSRSGINGAVSVFAPDGELRGVLNACEITAFRTALAVMVALVRFRHPVKNIVVFGAGRQAEWHILLSLILLDGRAESITVVNRAPRQRMDELLAAVAEKYPGVRPRTLLKTADDYDARLREALASADALFCCTPSTAPHFPYSYLQQEEKGAAPGKPRFISLIGSYKPDMQEIDAETLLSGGKVYADTREGCLSEAGELIMAGVGADQLVELGELEPEGRHAGEGNMVVKSVGLGIMDLAMAEELLDMGRERGLGVSVSDF